MNLFGTAGIRGPVQERVTPELALSVGRAVGRDAVRETDGAPSPVVVGWDGRETSDALAAAVESGLESAGVDVRRAGELPTPALAFASRGRRGVMITASHNPPEDNGIKLFDDGVEYDRAAERRVESLAADAPSTAPWDEWGSTASVHVLQQYRDAVAAYARSVLDDDAPLDDLSVVVDCGNGMAGLATPQVLRALGARVVTLNANVDGHFPGRESKPTREALSNLREFMTDGAFDLGIAHDGDADRIVILGPDGDIVHEDTILALLAERYVRESDAEDPVVVTTPNASARIDERVRAAGGRAERVRLGALHEGIARERSAGDDGTVVAFAAEPWKHVHPAFGGWIDGVASAAVFSGLVAEAGDIATRREPVTERPYRKVAVDCPEDAKDGAMQRLEETLPERFPEGSVSTEYGVRIELPDASWVLVRPSGTEPYVRVYAESDDVDALVEKTVDAVEQAVAASR
jgi:phosphomannomutase